MGGTVVGVIPSDKCPFNKAYIYEASGSDGRLWGEALFAYPEPHG